MLRYSLYLEVGEADAPSNISQAMVRCKLRAAFSPKQVFHLLEQSAGWLARWMLSGNKTKHWMRTIYALKSIWQLKKSSLDESGERDYWQAGKSVAGIESIETCEIIIKNLMQNYESGNK